MEELAREERSIDKRFLLFIGFRYAPADKQEARRRANALLTYASESASLRIKCSAFRPPFTSSRLDFWAWRLVLGYWVGLEFVARRFRQ